MATPTTTPGGQPLSNTTTVTQGEVTISGTGVSGLDSSEAPMTLPINPGLGTSYPHRVAVTTSDTEASVRAIAITAFNGINQPVLLDLEHSYVDFNATIALHSAVGSATQVSGGSSYTSAPTVTFSAPQDADGVTATGTATISGGAVTGVTITNPGSGYTSPPTISFSGGGGSGASFTAVLTQATTGQFTPVPWFYDPGATGGQAAGWYAGAPLQAITYTSGSALSFQHQTIRVEGFEGYVWLGIHSKSASTQVDINATQK